MSAEEELEQYETEIELQLYKEYRDVLPMFRYVVETERRFYLANEVRREVKNADGRVYFEIELEDAWVWDMYRPARFVSKVEVVTFRDVNIEELAGKDFLCPPRAVLSAWEEPPRPSSPSGWVSRAATSWPATGGAPPARSTSWPSTGAGANPSSSSAR